MKRIMLLIIALITLPVFAGKNCLDNSEHLSKKYDTKQWHSVVCNCNCPTLKGSRCIECGHLQRANPITIITPSRPISITEDDTTQTPQQALKFLAQKYLQEKMANPADNS